MRKTKHEGSFWVCFLFNVIINIHWILPSIVLLILHFCIDLSIWYAVAAFVLWLLSVFFWMKIIEWSSKCSNTPDPPKENKNPYSVKEKK